MLYSTIVQRDETGLNQIYEAAKELEDLNVLEAILLCKFDIRLNHGDRNNDTSFTVD